MDAATEAWHPPVDVQGIVVSILVATRADAPAAEVAHAELVAGQGIVGDRYADGTGTFSPRVMDPDHELTLIAIEEIEAFNAATGSCFSPAAFRRNVVTRGVPLDELVHREFMLGPVRVRGVRSCEPCAHLARTTDADVLPRMAGRAGLRAQIVRGGILAVGAPVIFELG